MICAKGVSMQGSCVSKIINTFFDRGECKENENIFKEYTKVLPIREMAARFLEIEDNAFGMYAFSRDPIEGKFSKEQKLEYIKSANECGRNEAELAYVKGRSLEQLALELKLSIDTPDTPNGGGNVIFAQFIEPDSITIFMDTVKRAEPLIKELKDLLGDIDVFSILLAHELFHAIEYQKNDTIYTLTEKAELWKKPFSNKSRLVCLSEIAGMAFCKNILKLKYSPYIFDVILMYGYSKEAATALYEDILEIVNE